jgi:hypothetical protein
MNDGHDQQDGRLHDVEDRIRKPVEKRPAEVLVDERIELRMVEDGRIGGLQLDPETNGQAGRDVTEIRDSRANVFTRLAGDDELETHSVPNNSARISAHGRADDGSA